MKNTKENTKKWSLNTDFNELTVRERRDALVLLYFLNEYREQEIAFKKLKSNWVDLIYRLPKTAEKGYNSVKNGRYIILKRIKKVFKEYLVEL